MRLVVESTALKALLRMPKQDADGLRAKLKVFAADPYGRHPWAKAFGKGMGRIRQGDWRAVYRIEGGLMTVFVVRIGHRGEIYE